MTRHVPAFRGGLSPSHAGQPTVHGSGPQTTRPCAARVHLIPEGRTRCNECRSERRRAKSKPVDPAAAAAIRDSWRFVPLPRKLTDEGACVNEDPALWDPIDPDVPHDQESARINRAKTLCEEACPVVALCRSIALERGVHKPIGVWGGMYFSQDRSSIQRARKREAS